MIPHESGRDDIAELADLVARLAEHLKPLEPDAAAVLDDIKDRAARLASSQRGPTRLRGLSADSIAVTEPDGSIRLVISGQGTFPTEIQIGGEVMQNPRPGLAGMLFFNDEAMSAAGWSLEEPPVNRGEA